MVCPIFHRATIKSELMYIETSWGFDFSFISSLFAKIACGCFKLPGIRGYVSCIRMRR